MNPRFSALAQGIQLVIATRTRIPRGGLSPEVGGGRVDGSAILFALRSQGEEDPASRKIARHRAGNHGAHTEIT
jgi:hypothetical protein